jgi:hypothetical protein
MYVQLLGRGERPFDTRNPKHRASLPPSTFNTFAPGFEAKRAAGETQQMLVIDVASHGHEAHFDRIYEEEGRPSITSNVGRVQVDVLPENHDGAASASIGRPDISPGEVGPFSKTLL